MIHPSPLLIREYCFVDRWFTNLSDTKSAYSTHEGLSHVLFSAL